MPKQINRPLTLSEVLRDEYEALDLIGTPILKDADKKEVEGRLDWRHGLSVREYLQAYAGHLNDELNIEKDWPKVLAMSLEDQAEQRRRREERQAKLVARLRSFLHRAYHLKTGPSALCVSGGGIRSATFCLGVIQSLANHQLLDKFDYLSSVSGGGYIASWLSAWIYRKRLATATLSPGLPGGFDKAGVTAVQAELNTHTAARPEPNEIVHLRKYSNYMSPIVGLFSTDTWVLIAVYLRNLLLNWTVIIPLLVAALLVPRLLVASFEYSFTEFRNWDVVLFIAVSFFGVSGISFINMMRPGLKSLSPFSQTYWTDEIGTTKSSYWVAFACLAPIILFSLAAAGYWSRNSVSLSEYGPWTYIIFGSGLFLGGYLGCWAVFLVRKAWLSLSGKTESAGHKTQTVVQAVGRRTREFINWIAEGLFSLICGGIGGLLLYFAVVKVFPVNGDLVVGMSEANFFVCFGAPVILTIFLVAAALFTGLAVRFTNDDDREWVTRFGAVVLKAIVGWTVFTSAVLFGPQIFYVEWGPFYSSLTAAVVAISGIFSVLSGFSRKTPAQLNEPTKDWTGSLVKIASSVVAPIVVLFLIMLTSYGTRELVTKILPGSAIGQALIAPLQTPDTHEISEYFELLLFGFLALIGFAMGAFININKFSFHATYRERLIRAYLGASNRDRFSTANSFTGFDTEADNVEMKDLRQRPLHVVNMTLNMVKSDNLAWQNRKAESFTSTTLHSGSSQMGGSGNYRDSERYGYNIQNDKAITLGTAAAISGAAASPNMGYFTQSTAVSFLMVLLNVRLGWWLGNPGQRGTSGDAWKKASPSWSPPAFLSEALELTDDLHRFVYLADGGQFENLGLYEMVLRRCKTIVVCDAGADPIPSFYDLGSAIHKIKVDMGIPIDFRHGKVPHDGKYGAIATIKYSVVDGSEASDGTLIYIKPTLNGKESIDIQHYKNENTTFPHETTADQFFSETQFESYRALGFCMMESICANASINDLTDLLTAADRNI